MISADKQKATYHLCDFNYNLEDQISYHPTYNEAVYNYSDGNTIEEYILSSIRNTSDISCGSSELLSYIKDWPTYYHFAIERANIFRFLEIEPNSKIIELGAGCGAITRYLGENYSSVDSIEGSKRRAKITRERCRDLDNVKVFCSNIENIQFNHEYDVATLIGVLEYAPVYFSDNQKPESACLTLLKLAYDAIKEDGTLILAIENKIGLKYWSGCQEDHTGIIYEGLHGYPNKVGPVTFSKKEIIELLKKAGFNNCIVLGCYPDYKFASTIISDVNDDNNYYLYNWIETPFVAYDVIRKYSFDERFALKTLYKAGLLGEYANSFLILASNGNSTPMAKINWIAKKISAKRRKELECQTTLRLKPHIFIEKKRLHGENIETTFANDEFTLHHRVSNSMWIPGNTLQDEMYMATYKKGSDKVIKQLLFQYYKIIIKKYSTGTFDKKGYPLLKGTSIDFVPKNIINNNGILESIDEEWTIEGNIPADYLLYRFLIYDFSGLQRPWVKGKFINKNYVTIKLIRIIFPKYNIERHIKNRKREISLQNLVGAGIKYSMPKKNLRCYIRKFPVNFLK